MVQLFRTCSNHSTTQETRPVVELDMSLAWFNPFEPWKNTGNQAEFHMSSGSWALPNFLEPLSSRGNKDHRIISHEFRVVQLFRTCSNHSTTQVTMPAAEFDMSSGWFNRTEPARATLLQGRCMTSSNHREQGP